MRPSWLGDDLFMPFVRLREACASLFRYIMRSTCFFVGIASLPIALHAAEPARISFDLPAATADKSLKLFSEQSGLEVLFLTETATAVRTNAVKGHFTAREAVDRMLAGTNLKAAQNEKTGAVRIVPNADPNAPRVAQMLPPSDRAARPAANPLRPDDPIKSARSAETGKRPNAAKRIIGAIAGFFLGSVAAHAQTPAESAAVAREGYGIVAGQVLNETTKDYLSGASVRVEGSGLDTITGDSGTFSVSVPEGDYIVVVNYTGLQPARVPVTVRSGQVASINVPLNSEIYKIEAYTVRGLREGQAAAIQNQRQSMNVKSVAAIDAYGNPGASMGELIQRLPGVAVDLGAGGEPSAIYLRGMSQNFTSMMIDGNTLPVSDGQTVASNYINLGQVSTNNIEALEIIKSPTPDMDGNAISGYINLRTKRAFDRAPGQIITATVGTKWADLKQHDSVPGKDLPKLDLMTLGYSNVFSVLGGRNNLGVSATVNHNAYGAYGYEAGPWLSVGYNNMFFVAPPAPGEKPQPLLRTWGAGHRNTNTANTYAKNYGVNVDYKAGPDTVLYFKGTLGDTRVEEGSYPGYFRWRLYANQSAANFAPGSTYDLVTATGGTIDLESVYYVLQRKTFLASAGLERKLFSGSGMLTVDASYSRDEARMPAINEVKARINGVGFQIDRRGRDPWHPVVRQTAGLDWSDPASYTFVGSQANGSRIIDFHVPAMRSNIKADFRKNLQLAVPGYIKLGLKHSVHRITSDRRYAHYTWAGPGGTPATGGITPYVGHNMIMGEDNYGPFPFLQTPTTGLPNDPWADPSNWRQTPAQVWLSTLQTLSGYADSKETISAGYVQGHIKLNRLSILAGLRAEQTTPTTSSPRRVIITTGPNANTSAPNLSAEENIARAQANYPSIDKATSDYKNVFPGLHFVYRIADGLQARASYNVSITRPALNLLLPNFQVQDNTRIVSIGNPDLKPYTSDNFEARIEYYFEPIGRLSAGVFLKEIANYFRSFDSVIGAGSGNGFDGEFEGYTLRQNRNVGGARIQGLELEYSQQFMFLPGWLRGFGVDANMTFLETKGDFGGLTTVTRLPNFTPRTLNAGVTYKARRFDLRLMGNYRGRTYVGSAVAGSDTASGTGVGGIIGRVNFDLYNDSRLLFDFKSQLTINRTFSLYFDVYNLTNEWSLSRSFDAFGGRHGYLAQREGVIYHAGVKARF